MRQTRSSFATTRLWFLAFTLIGGAGVVLGNLLASHWVGICVPLVALFAYGLFGNRVASPIPREIFADTVYYQGFLFTIVALVASLLFQSDEGGIDKIVSNFAVALLTTMVGLIWRVVLTSFSASPDESKESVQDELDQASRRVRGQLERLHGDLSALHDVVMSTTTRSLEEASANVKGAITEARAEIARGSAAFAEELSGHGHMMAASWGSSLSRLEGDLSEAMGRLQDETAQTVHRLNEASTGLVSSLDRIELPADVLVRPLRPALEKLHEMLQMLADQTDTIMATASLERLHGQLETVADASSRLAGTLEGGAQAAGHLQEFIGQQTQRQAELNESMDGYLTSAKQHREEVQRSSHEVEESTRLFRDQLRQAAHYLRKALEA